MNVIIWIHIFFLKTFFEQRLFKSLRLSISKRYNFIYDISKDIHFNIYYIDDKDPNFKKREKIDTMFTYYTILT